MHYTEWLSTVLTLCSDDSAHNENKDHIHTYNPLLHTIFQTIDSRSHQFQDCHLVMQNLQLKKMSARSCRDDQAPLGKVNLRLKVPSWQHGTSQTDPRPLGGARPGLYQKTSNASQSLSSHLFCEDVLEEFPHLAILILSTLIKICAEINLSSLQSVSSSQAQAISCARSQCPY